MIFIDYLTCEVEQDSNLFVQLQWYTTTEVCELIM